MSAKPKLRSVTVAPMRPVNAGESSSCVGSENDVIARAYSLLYSVIGEHPGRLNYAQACDVVMWAGIK